MSLEKLNKCLQGCCRGAHAEMCTLTGDLAHNQHMHRTNGLQAPTSLRSNHVTRCHIACRVCMLQNNTIINTRHWRTSARTSTNRSEPVLQVIGPKDVHISSCTGQAQPISLIIIALASLPGVVSFPCIINNIDSLSRSLSLSPSMYVATHVSHLLSYMYTPHHTHTHTLDRIQNTKTCY